MKVFRSFLVQLAIMLISSLFLITGCTKKEKEPETIRIGAILPLTGDIAEYGNRIKKGIDLAIEEIENQGGINGKRAKVLYEDSTGFPKGGVSAVQKLISINRVPIIIGAVASSVTLAIVPQTTESKVVLFSPASSSPKLSGVSPFFFRDWPSDVLEARLLAEFTFNKLGIKKVAILNVNNDYGLGRVNSFFSPSIINSYS